MAKATLVKGIVITAAIIGVGAAGYYLAPTLTGPTSVTSSKQATPKPLGSFIGNTVSAEEWSQPEALQAKLATALNSRLKGTSPSDIEAFMKEPENLLLLAQWQLAANDISSREPSAKQKDKFGQELAKLNEKLQKLQEDQRKATPAQAKNIQQDIDKLLKQISDKQEQIDDLFSLTEYAQTPGAKQTLEAVQNNLDWMQQILQSGECERPARTLALIGAMLQAHPESAYNQVERDIITATALEFANNGWRTDRALDRADYFITNWRANRLHTMFDTLPFWQRRMVCGCKGDNSFCTRESLEWALDHVHLPADKYPGACWRNGYKLYNLYGEIIHGPGYWEPFNGLFDENTMEFTNKVGGVCGYLSHFGAYSACANGVPAATSGEPGHCSFVVLVDGKWTPAYSLTWNRGMHWTPWSGMNGFTALHMASDLYSPEQRDKTARSQVYHSLANVYATQAQPDFGKASVCYRQAIDAQPCNYMAWRSYAEFLKARKPMDHAVWAELNGLVCSKLAKSLPQMAADVLTRHVYPQMAESSGSREQLLEEFNLLWRSVGDMGVERWNVENMLTAQLNYFKEDKKLTDQCKTDVYGTVLKSIINNGVYAPVVLAWGSELAAKMNPESQRKLLDTTVAAISGSQGVESADRDKMLASAIINAEQMRDRKAFQSISKMLSEAYTKPKAQQPKFEPFPGKLVSEDGLLYLSSSSRQHDDPCAHPGVLRPEGGRFHTNKDEEAWAVVELSRLVEVTGVVVIATPGNLQRLHGMRVQVSESGKDGEWKDVGTAVDKVTQRVNRYDLGAGKPRARFVRVLRPKPANFFHLSGIYVYGTPAS